MKKTENEPIKIPVLLGPTATGKTAFAVRLAHALDAEIISADSRQLYRHLDIGSGKDIGEYTLENGVKVPYHLIDIADPGHEYNLAEFMRDCANAIRDISSRGLTPLVAGGTALYIDSILKNYALSGGAQNRALRDELDMMEASDLTEMLRRLDPACGIIANEPNNRSRMIRRIEKLSLPKGEFSETRILPDIAPLVMGVLRDRHDVHKRIEARLDSRLAEGMLDEAVKLHDELGVSWERLEFFGLEYRYMALHLQGKMTFQEMRDALLIKIRQFAKRQDSWFRRMERDGADIYWFRPDEVEKAVTLCRKFLAGEPIPKPSFRLSETFYGPVQTNDRKAKHPQTVIEDAVTDEQLGIIRDLAFRIWPGVYSGIIPESQIGYMLEMMYSPEVMRNELKEGIRFILLKLNGKYVGYASFGRYSDDVCKLHKIYILEEARGQGCGRKLVERALAEAKAGCFRKMILNVNRNNTSSIAAYKACGFRIESTLKKDIGDGFFMDDYIMGKEIS